MADFKFCIEQAISANKITKALGKEILEAQDPEQAIANISSNLAIKKREAAIQAVRMAAAWENINAHPKGLYEGLIGLLTKDPSGKAPYNNVEYLGRVYTGQLDSMFAEAMSRFRTRRLGFSQDEKGLNDFVRAIYGEAVEDVEIKGLADDWHKVAEKAKAMFNERGGSIGKDPDWLLPQNHDMKSIEKTGLDAWKNKITPMIDRTKMTDDAGKQLTDEQFSKSLDYVYETITTAGLNKTKDFSSLPAGGKKLSRKGSDSRFLYFKDAESWLEYQKSFGRGDIFTTLTDWLDNMGNDIAAMEVLGTNPNTTYDALKNQINKKSKMTQRQSAFSDAVFKVVTGKTNIGELTTMADFMQSTTNVLVASTLGGAFISSISDMGTLAITAKYNGMGATKTLARQLSLMNPANEADRTLAVRMGLIAEAWKTRAHGSNRYADVYGNGITAKIAEGVMRGSLLSPWTDAGRKAFGMEFAGMLSDNFAKPLSELDDSLQKAFTTYGIDEAGWDTFRKTKPLESKGAKFADVTQDGGVNFHKMIVSEMDFAVPTPDARVKAITTGGTGRGTVAGQGWRAVMMLKSFPITIASTHFYRAAYQSTTAGILAYSGTFLASASVLGGLALQAKDIAAGREPRPVDSKFVGAALVQGGGLGIFGDFIFSDINRFGGGPIATAFGPKGEAFEAAAELTAGNIQQAVRGEETEILGETADFIKRYTPDTWQIRLFTDSIYDQMILMVDDGRQQKLNRVIKRRRKEYDQGYWWRPGDTITEVLQ